MLRFNAFVFMGGMEGVLFQQCAGRFYQKPKMGIGTWCSQNKRSKDLRSEGLKGLPKVSGMKSW